MFVRKDKDGNLVAVGSIDQSLLTQLQGKLKKDSAKAESKTSSDEPAPAEPTPATVEPKTAVEPKVEPKAKPSTSTPRP